MTPSKPHHEWKARLIRRLAIVVDEHRTNTVRIAAVRAVQQMLDPTHPLRSERPDDLLGSVLWPWDRREELRGGRWVQCTVARPPKGLGDVWR